MVKRPKGDPAPPQAARRSGEWHGRQEAASWLDALGLAPSPRWHVEVSLDTGASTKFHLNVYAEEWGFAFHHARRSSWIRVTDIPFVHGRDDFGLIVRVPELLSLGGFIVGLEHEHGFKLVRSKAIVRSNLGGATRVVRRWLSRERSRPDAPSANELCGDEMHDGIRCTLERGHDGDHTFESSEGALQSKE